MERRKIHDLPSSPAQVQRTFMGIRRREGRKGETKEQALVRECKEELAIDINIKDDFCHVTHVYPDITIALTLFNAEIAEGTPKLLEHVDLKWITPSEIPLYDFCPADKEILEKIAKDGKS